MAYGVTHFFAGGTQEQYDAVLEAVHPYGDGLPKGQIFHAEGDSEGGWTIMVLHDSPESWEAFRDGTLIPRFEQGIDGGFSSPPVETGFEAYEVLP